MIRYSVKAIDSLEQRMRLYPCTGHHVGKYQSRLLKDRDSYKTEFLRADLTEDPLGKVAGDLIKYFQHDFVRTFYFTALG